MSNPGVGSAERFRWRPMRSRRNWITVGLLVIVSLVFHFVLAPFDLIEQFLEFAAQHESWELDEMAMLPLVWTVILLAHAKLRWFELEAEVAKRAKAEERLATLNESLEEQVQQRTQTLEETLERLKDAHARYELAAEGSEDGLWEWVPRKNELHCSATFAAVLGCGEESRPTGQPQLEDWLNHASPVDRDALRATLERQGRLGGKASTEFRVHDSQTGTVRWIECRSAASIGADGRVERVAGSLRDVTGYRAVDSLTGLANRAQFGERLLRALRQCHQADAPTFAVLFMDLDRFKDINDSLGHLAGDALLVEVGRRLRKALRSGDAVSLLRGEEVVARLGGDEFAVLLSGVSTERDAVAIGERVLKIVTRPTDLEGRTIRPGASVGIALGSPQYRIPDEILRDADTAMYASKSKGRGRVELFVPSMREELLKSLQLETDLAEALVKGELFLEYQPQISLANGALRGFEALMRWRHPKFGLISPLRFIGIAEKTGAIIDMGAWGLREVCRQIAEWLHGGLLAEHLVVSVNISAKQLEQGDFVGCVRDALMEFSVPPRRLSLEVTETCLISDSAGTLSVLQALKALGVRLDIDDFGTGYSTFDYLCRLPFDTLKIDRRFVQDLDDATNLAVVKTLISLSKRLGLEVIAEGIETERQLAHLSNLGCESVQGFYFSPPVGGVEARAWLTAGRPPPPSSSSQGGQDGEAILVKSSS